MAVDSSKVLTGAPDQLTTGAIWVGPKMVPYKEPQDPFTSSLPAGFADSGYVSEDGLKLTTDRSTADIKDWNGDIVRKILEEFSGTLVYSHLEFSEFALRESYGDENVSMLKAAAKSNGKQTKVKINAADLPIKARWFRMKDGDARVVILAPNCQVTEVGEVSFVKSEAIKIENTISCYPDDQGNLLYIFLDDGIYAAGSDS